MGGPNHIYFLAPIGGGPIKIGFSNDVMRRLRDMSELSPYPLETLCTALGGREDEARLHAKFADLHSHREWFRPGMALLAFIQQVRFTGHLPAELRDQPVPRAAPLPSKRKGARTAEQCARISAGLRAYWERERKRRQSA